MAISKGSLLHCERSGQLTFSVNRKKRERRRAGDGRKRQPATMSVTYPRPEVLMLFSVPLYQRLGDVMSACQTAQTNKPVRSMSPNTKPHLEVAVSSRPPPSNRAALWGHLCLSVIVFPPDLCSSAYDAGNLSHSKTNKKQWGGDTCLRLHVVFFFSWNYAD